MIAVVLESSEHLTSSTEALIDTGAEISLFDAGIAYDLNLDLESLPSITVSGVGGLVREAKLAAVTLFLLGRAEVSAFVQVAFAPDVEQTHGNLIGLDVLEHFDFGLSHAQRLGYLGRPVP